jgi:hypothetical protein
VPGGWSRRGVLVAGGLGVLGALTGCGVHLEDDAPRIPFVPTRQPIADEAALLRARSRAQELREDAEAADGPPTGLPARLAGLHTEQASTMTALLQGLGVPLPRHPTTPSSGVPSPRHSTSAVQARPSKGSTKRRARVSVLQALARAERRDATAQALARLSDVSPTNVALLASLAAQHHAAARLLGAEPHRPRLAGPSRDLAARLLDSARAAVYGFEVITARTPIDGRKAPAATLQALQSLTDTLERLAGRSASTPPKAYRLPIRPHDAATRTTLARHVLAGLSSSTAGLLPGAAGDADALTGLVLVLSDSVVLGRDWGVPLTPFPGLQQP